MQESPSNSLFGTFENRVNVADWEMMRSVPYKYNNTEVIIDQRNPYEEQILFDFPFWPFLSVTEGGLIKVSFATGYVIQRLVRKTPTNDGKYITYRVPNNVNTLLTIPVGGSAYVRVTVSNKGEIQTDPVIQIFGVGSAPTGDRYYPSVGEFAGQAGSFYYKLGTLESDGSGGYKFDRFHSGDNIEHIIERVEFWNNTASINYDEPVYGIHTYDPENDRIELQRIRPLENVGDGRFILKEHLGFDTYRLRSLKQLDGGEPIIKPVVDEEASDVIEFKSISGKYGDVAQINVSTVEDTIIVEGNGKSGSLDVISCGESPTTTTLLTWEDGLITNDENYVSFVAGCSGLPEGVRGDTLYHDGTDWVVLNKPASYTTHVLAISGDIPYWLETQDCDEETPPTSP
jgi:hypothetical protein